MVAQDTQLTVYGGRNEIKELGDRLRKMMPSAQAFSEGEALAVAQIAHAHGLDPFNGEVWGIKRQDTGQWYGVMVGIKGLRKAARRAAAAENSSYWLDFTLVDAKKYNATQEHAVVYECELRDASNMGAYGKAIHNLTDSGIPYKEAIEMVGKPPVVVGIGIAWPAEKSKMSLHSRAKKRAEADALKMRYDVEFGSAQFTVEEGDGEIVDGEITPGFEDQTVDDAFKKPEKLAAEVVDDLMGAQEAYYWGSNEIAEVVAKTKKLDKATAMQALMDAHKAGKIADNLTIADAKAFANSLNA
jgi:hypothetical protein